MKSILQLKQLFLSLCLLLSLNSQAAHIIGGEMTYECLGNEEYKITMTLYRDCNGGGAEFDGAAGSIGPATITFFRGSAQFGNTLDLNDLEIDFVPLDVECGNTSNICVEKGVYEFTRTLASSTQSYHITYQRCCRNNTLANILEPETTGSTTTIEITPQAQNTCNNSPVFNTLPPIFITVGEPLNLDVSATDADGDDLVYSFCTPYSGGGTGGVAPNSPPGAAQGLNGVTPDPDAPPPYNNVSFVAPLYSGIEPIPNVVMNHNTGLITGTTNSIIGQFLIGVCVQEYRNGVLLSTVRREIQVNIRECWAVSTKEISANILSLYPNPSDDYLQLILPDNGSTIQVDIFNLNGTLIAQQRLGNSNNKISVVDLPNGAYFINTTDENGLKSFGKFVKY